MSKPVFSAGAPKPPLVRIIPKDGAKSLAAPTPKPSTASGTRALIGNSLALLVKSTLSNHTLLTQKSSLMSFITGAILGLSSSQGNPQIPRSSPNGIPGPSLNGILFRSKCFFLHTRQLHALPASLWVRLEQAGSVPQVSSRPKSPRTCVRVSARRRLRCD